MSCDNSLLSPFSKKYWDTAAKELTSIRTLTVAALMIALRVALKVVDIPLGIGISIGVGFIVNALMGSVCGPIIALMAGAITDILGYIVDPQGAYMFLFTLVEMLGSFIYALFLYRRNISFTRLLLCKLTVNVLVNIICQNVLFYIYDYLGKAKLVTITMSVIKNVVLLPIEVMALVLVFGALIIPLKKLKVFPPEQEQVKISAVQLVVLAVVMVAAIVVAAVFYPDIKTFVKALLT